MRRGASLLTTRVVASLLPALLAPMLLVGCAPSKAEKVEVTYYYMPG